MAKPVLVRAGPNVPRLMYPVFYGLAFLLGLALIGLIIGGGPTIVLAVLAFLLALFLIIPVREHLIQAKIKKAFKIMEATITGLEDESELRFSKPLRLRPVIFKVVAYKSRITWPGVYKWSAEIEPKGVFETRVAHVFKDLSYGIVVNKGGEGEAILPGIEFDENKIRDIVLFYIPPKQPFIEPLQYVLKTPRGQVVEIETYEGPGVSGEAKMFGEGKASIYLAAKPPGFLKQIRIKLADLKTGIARFSAKLALDKPVLVVVHKKSSLKGIIWNLPKPLIGGDRLHYNLVVVFKRGILGKFTKEIELHISR